MLRIPLRRTVPAGTPDPAGPGPDRNVCASREHAQGQDCDDHTQSLKANATIAQLHCPPPRPLSLDAAALSLSRWPAVWCSPTRSRLHLIPLLPGDPPDVSFEPQSGARTQTSRWSPAATAAAALSGPGRGSCRPRVASREQVAEPTDLDVVRDAFVGVEGQGGLVGGADGSKNTSSMQAISSKPSAVGT